MESPVCVCCEKELVAWNGNIMVDMDELFRKDYRKIDNLEVWCKDCTKRISGRSKHNLLELIWVKEDYFDHFNQLFFGEVVYTQEALSVYMRLGEMIYKK